MLSGCDPDAVDTGSVLRESVYRERQAWPHVWQRRNAEKSRPHGRQHGIRSGVSGVMFRTTETLSGELCAVTFVHDVDFELHALFKSVSGRLKSWRTCVDKQDGRESSAESVPSLFIEFALKGSDGLDTETVTERQKAFKQRFFDLSGRVSNSGAPVRERASTCEHPAISTAGRQQRLVCCCNVHGVTPSHGRAPGSMSTPACSS